MNGLIKWLKCFAWCLEIELASSLEVLPCAHPHLQYFPPHRLDKSWPGVTKCCSPLWQCSSNSGVNHASKCGVPQDVLTKPKVFQEPVPVNQPVLQIRDQTSWGEGHWIAMQEPWLSHCPSCVDMGKLCHLCKPVSSSIKWGWAEGHVPSVGRKGSQKRGKRSLLDRRQAGKLWGSGLRSQMIKGAQN